MLPIRSASYVVAIRRRGVNDGPRHVVDGKLYLGSFIDSDVDGVPGTTATGDDLTIAVSEQGMLFQHFGD